MSAAATEVLDLLSRQIIDVGEALRLLKAIKNSSRRPAGPMPDIQMPYEPEIWMEAAGAGLRPQFGYGNIIMK
jgi:hypothetical protein